MIKNSLHDLQVLHFMGMRLKPRIISLHTAVVTSISLNTNDSMYLLGGALRSWCCRCLPRYCFSIGIQIFRKVLCPSNHSGLVTTRSLASCQDIILNTSLIDNRGFTINFMCGTSCNKYTVFNYTIAMICHKRLSILNLNTGCARQQCSLIPSSMFTLVHW